MKFLLFLILFSQYAVSQSIFSAKVTASSNNIPTAYGTGAGSQFLTGISDCSHISVTNNTSSDIAVSLESPTCASTNADDVFVAASSVGWFDNVSINKVVCVRSDTGSLITSGDIKVSAWQPGR